MRKPIKLLEAAITQQPQITKKTSSPIREEVTDPRHILESCHIWAILGYAANSTNLTLLYLQFTKNKEFTLVYNWSYLIFLTRKDNSLLSLHCRWKGNPNNLDQVPNTYLGLVTCPDQHYHFESQRVSDFGLPKIGLGFFIYSLMVSFSFSQLFSPTQKMLLDFE